MEKWLQGFAYRINIIENGWVFILAVLLSVVLAMITVSFQSVKAALANPTESLRNE